MQAFILFFIFSLDRTLSLMPVTRERSACLVIWSLGVLDLPTRAAMEQNFSLARKEGSCRIFLVAALTIDPSNYLAEA